MVYFRVVWIVVSDLDDPSTRHHSRQVVRDQSWNKNWFWSLEESTGTDQYTHSSSWMAHGRPNAALIILSIHTSTLRILLGVVKDGIKDDIPKTPFPLLIFCGRNMFLNFPSMHPYVLSQTYSKSHHGPTWLRCRRSLQKMHRKL